MGSSGINAGTWGAAYLTKSDVKILGPKNMEQLKTAKVCNPWPQYDYQLTRFVGSQLFPPSDMPQQDRLSWAKDMLEKGDCAAIVDSEEGLRTLTMQDCSRLHINRDIAFGDTLIYFVMRGNETERCRAVSETILKVLGTPAYTELVRRNMKFGVPCDDGGGEDLDSQQIGIEQMSVGFIVYAALAVLAVLATLAQRVSAGSAL